MQLTKAQSARIEAKTGGEAIQRNSTLDKKLVKAFGAHTFFKSAKGLFIVEPTTDPDRPDRKLVRRIRVASWANAEKTELTPRKAGAESISV